MNDQPPIAPYSIADFLQWQGSKQLVLQPKFQRGVVWSEKAQSYLIDTIIRKLPIPPIVVRLKLDVANRKTVREVVDGQQRLTAVFKFCEGSLPILAVEGSPYGGKYFTDLTPEEQQAILSYKFAVWTLEFVPDEEVLSIFARMNTFVVPLNRQELRNASHFGQFKQSSYSLASKHLEFWRANRVFSDSQIARMINVQFTSIILMTFDKGIVSTKQGDIDDVYKNLDEQYPNRARFEERFSRCLSVIAELLPDLSKLAIRREVHFYSLLVLIYDALYGLKGGKGPRALPNDARQRLIAFSDDIKRIKAAREGLSEDEAAFQRASSRATADAGSRRARHDYMWKRVFEA